MATFDDEQCRRQYFTMVRERPDLFANPSGDIFEIVLDPAEINLAQQQTCDDRRNLGWPVDDLRVGVLAEDPYILALRDAVRFPSGRYGLYNRIIAPPSVLVLPVSPKGIALIYRFRHALRRFQYEAPQGIASGETEFAEAAIRELNEEIGAKPTKIVDLGGIASSSGIVSDNLRLLLAHIDSIGRPEREEAIARIEVISIDDVKRMIREGIISDGPTIAAFTRALLRNLL